MVPQKQWLGKSFPPKPCQRKWSAASTGGAEAIKCALFEPCANPAAQASSLDQVTGVDAPVILAMIRHPKWECPSGGTVDAADSKSVVRKDVGVRVPPGAPNKINDLGRLTVALSLQKRVARAYKRITFIISALPTVTICSMQHACNTKRRNVRLRFFRAAGNTAGKFRARALSTGARSTRKLGAA
jgi:hypothetical protein